MFSNQTICDLQRNIRQNKTNFVNQPKHDNLFNAFNAGPSLNNDFGEAEQIFGNLDSRLPSTMIFGGVDKISPSSSKSASSKSSKSQVKQQASKLVKRQDPVSKPSTSAYEAIINGMTGNKGQGKHQRDFHGSINTHIDSDSEGEQANGDKPFTGEDLFLPHAEQLKQKGITFNEWKDKRYQWDQQVQMLNRQIFQNERFREGQLEIINAALSGRDVMALIPTGGGKSLCFQLPALVDNGYTFVIMPLISLIEDQAYQLRQRNIKAFAFSKFNYQSSRQKNFYSDLLGGDRSLKLIYLTPEKLVHSGSFMSILDQLYSKGRISRFVIDEVHCVSQWGQDFRKDYRDLNLLRMRYPNVPIMALTATATVPVKYDIVQILKLKNVVYFQQSFNRANLNYQIVDKQKIKNQAEDIYLKIRDNFQHQSGIIYCLSRKECEELCLALQQFPITCDFYHAKMTDHDRKQVQLKWMQNEIKIIIATIAFGMGINKKDVRFVIHTTIPKSLENYAQECGRAGRDGKPAECVLYYSYSDRKRLEYFIITNSGNTMGRKNENLHALYKMLEYCEEPYLCRRKILLNYLGEDFRSRHCNLNCDNCRKSIRIGEVDYTEQARVIVYLIEQAIRKKMDLTTIQLTNFLRGKKSGIQNCSKNSKLGDLRNMFFGRLEDYKDETIKRIIMKLLIYKVLKEKFNSNRVEETIMVYINLGRMIESFKRGQIRIILTDSVSRQEENDLKKLKNKAAKEQKALKEQQKMIKEQQRAMKEKQRAENKEKKRIVKEAAKAAAKLAGTDNASPVTEASEQSPKKKRSPRKKKKTPDSNGIPEDPFTNTELKGMSCLEAELSGMNVERARQQREGVIEANGRTRYNQ